MVTYFRRLFTDEGAFLNLIRALRGGFALLATEGEVLKGVLAPETANLVGAAALAAALFMRSSAAVPKP